MSPCRWKERPYVYHHHIFFINKNNKNNDNNNNNNNNNYYYYYYYYYFILKIGFDETFYVLSGILSIPLDWIGWVVCTDYGVSVYVETK